MFLKKRLRKHNPLKKGTVSMIYTLTKDRISIRVSSLGAELKSVCLDGFEYLWQGDPTYWKGQSPILFPIIGGVPDDQYSWKGKTYRMEKHGFARRSEFELAEQTEDSLILRITDTPETRESYPFSFVFEVVYTIKGNTLSEGFRIRNTGSEEMPFSVGGHPAFNCPLETGKDFSDYRLEFEKPETLLRRIKRDGLLSGESHVFLDDQAEKDLTHGLFYDDAVILSDVSSNWVELFTADDARSIHVDFTGFPYLGIWSAQNDAPFLCIEPWFGVDSTKGDSGAFEEKEGIRILSAGDTFEAAFSMTLN